MNPVHLALLTLPTVPPVLEESPALRHERLAPTTSVQEPLQFPEFRKRERWATRGMVLQGFFGASFYETVEQSGGSAADVDGADEDAAQAPVLGGGAQWKLGGERIDLGLEAMFAFSWRSNATAIAVGGGGAAVAVDIDMFLFELYGGPVANIFLGDSTRVYASAGPLIQWADYSQDDPLSSGSDSGSGFGTGWYARTGIEFTIMPGTMLGLGVRWSDSTVDLDGGLGDLDLAGLQAVLTVTQGF
ncbi:MAG: hypothetical protein JNK02_10630 [Planctomycetes bacterium]|nr:hypothetical protein [Planctomycetota bacterium]